MTNKTLKKITLKKETISNLNDNQMNTVDGGTGGTVNCSQECFSGGCGSGDLCSMVCDSGMFGNCYTGFGGWC